MERNAADEAPETAEAPAEEPSEAPATEPAVKRRLRIDVSPALHEAGHEVADLGFEGIPDTGPVLHPEQGHARPDDPLDFVNVQIPSD